MSRGAFRSRRALACIAVTIVGFSVLGSGIAGAASSGQGPAATILWPEDENATLSTLENRTKSATTATDPLVLGKAPITSFTGERIDPTTSRLQVTTSDGNQTTVRQEHREIDDQGHVVVDVSPEGITTTIELVPGPRTGLVLTILVPPGSLEVNGTTAEEKAEALAEDLGLPSTQGWDRAARQASPQLYDGERACFEEGGGTCEINATFRVACEGCFQLVRTVPPDPNAELEDAWDSGPAVGAPHLNEQRFWFTEDDQLFGAVLFLHVDLDTGQLIEPAAALASLEERTGQRGYTIPQEEEETANAALEFPIPQGKASPGSAEYHWTVGVANASREARHDQGSVRAVQDARSGEVVDMTFRFVPPGETSEGAAGSQDPSGGSSAPSGSGENASSPEGPPGDNTTASEAPSAWPPLWASLAAAAAWLTRAKRS